MLSKLLFIGTLVISVHTSAQMNGSLTQLKRRLIDIEITKTGPYFGIQRGKYTVLEIGVERQWKKIRIRQPIIHAAHAGFNYNFKYNMLGYDMGYWYKPNRIGLTYGGNLFFRTNFDNTRVGIAPVVGFKFSLLHLQTGYHFMTRLPDNFETNKFFISLRIGIINDRDVDFNMGKKKKKK
jgi:hypothetical protein